MKKVYSPLIYVLSCLLLLVLFYGIQRLLFLVWNNHAFVEAAPYDLFTAFLHGLRFDIYSLILINIVPILFSLFNLKRHYRKQIDLLNILIIFFNIPFLIINQIDIEFSNFAGRRMTLGNLHILGEAQGKISSFIFTYGFLIVLQLCLLTTLIYLVVKVAKYFKENPVELKTTSYVFLLLFFLPSIAIGARGGLQRRPLSISHSMIFQDSYLNQLVLNSTFTMIRSKSTNLLREKNYFSSHEELTTYLNGFDNKNDKSLWERDLSKEKTNVVILIVESLSLEYMKFTPFITELSKKGLFFENNYSNGRRSIEGATSILAGIPSLMPVSYIASNYFNNDLKGLGTYFKTKNYYSSFFHGGQPGTMFFDVFSSKAGFDRFYTQEDHPTPSDFDGTWGIFDEPFLQYAITEFDKYDKPFLSAILTLSSHHPYVIPDKYKNVLKKSENPMEQPLRYADLSVENFFKVAQSKPWYNNTLFIITSDHSSFWYEGEFNTVLGIYRVPLILYHPKIIFPKIDNEMVTQHVDILPTLLDLFKIDDRAPLFGKSIFKKGHRYNTILADQTYYLIDKSYVVQMTPDQVVKTHKIKDKSNFEKLDEDNIELEKKLKATIQYFNNSLIQNSLYK